MKECAVKKSRYTEEQIAYAMKQAESLAIKQAVRATRVEPQDPVAHNLKGHTPDLGSLAPAAAVVNLSQGQQPTGLVRAFRLPRQLPQGSAAKIIPQANCRSHKPTSSPNKTPRNENSSGKRDEVALGFDGIGDTDAKVQIVTKTGTHTGRRWSRLASAFRLALFPSK